MKSIVGILGVLLVLMSSVTAEVLINEIMYDVNGSDSGREWIEILNTGSESINLSSWKLLEQGTNHNLQLVLGISLLREGEFAVFANDAISFQKDNPAFTGNLFDSVFSLSNSGEYLALYNGSDLIPGVNYSASWGGGNSYSLERVNETWNTSLIQNGTPGKTNSLIPCISALVTTFSDWLNQTACQINDTYIQNRGVFQYDQYSCQQNQTWIEYQDLRCDYCIPSWSVINSSCTATDAIIRWYNDSNNCFGQTTLASDLAGRPDNITHALICDYNSDGFIGNISDATISFEGALEQDASGIRFKHGNKIVVEFSFLGRTVSLADLFIEIQSNESFGYLIVRGWTLNETQTETVYVDKLNISSNSVCVKDTTVFSIAEVSSACGDINETIVSCDGQLQQGYTCTNGSMLMVTGLRHSAVKEMSVEPALAAPAPESSSSSGGGGGGGGGSSCPTGKTLLRGKCVTTTPPILPQTKTPLSPTSVNKENTLIRNRPSVIVVEKDIEIDFSNSRPIQKSVLAGALGDELTGAVAATPKKSLKMVPLMVFSTLVILGGGVVWFVKGKKML